MDRLDAMRLFVRAVETGSFSAVARERGIGQPAVSKQMAALEAHLGARLLHRTTRSVALTEAGQTYYEATVRLLDDLDAAESLVGRRQAMPTGLLRVGLSAGFGRLVVVPLLPDFHRRYPEITLDLMVSDRFVDLVEEGVDVAIRLGGLGESRLIARRIGATPRVTVGSRAYLERAGRPSTPADLDHHDCIAFTFASGVREWAFAGPTGPIRHLPTGPVRANDAEHIRAALLADLGLAQVPRWLVAAELASGEVQEVLQGFPGERTPIRALHPAGRRPVAKARVFVDHLAGHLASDPDLRP